jgi:hypothetical protein
MKFCEKHEVEMLKIIMIIIGYTLNDFTKLKDHWLEELNFMVQELSTIVRSPSKLKKHF